MKIFIMRHGEAEHFADSDAARELTQRGRTESEAVARACAEQGFAQFDKVLVSPYIRAQQTWQEISTFFSTKASRPVTTSHHTVNRIVCLILQTRSLKSRN